ncbi:MAG: hypothetical protein ACYTFO_04000 [Planctomycetota bacterium]|jgi:hypothetical protein
MRHLRIRQFSWLGAALVLLIAGGFLRSELSGLARTHELYVEAAGSAGMPAIRAMPGGLRALVFNYAWIRSQQQHMAGRHYDARQLAELACRLMPTFPGVWAFHAWNMAWNISVTTHTDQERWHWVQQGLKLLRDDAIPHNRKALLLYKELGWIFFFKMGQGLDESHRYYKRRWAAEMQHLLGAPPLGTTEEVIAAFRPIAEAPLDRSFRRQGSPIIQPDQRRIVLADRGVMEYAALLAAQGVGFDSGFLTVYNRLSRDDAVMFVRTAEPPPADAKERLLAELINDPDHAEARGKMLAFLRAQMLWNVYRMDPAWMLAIMERYHAPFDWRMVYPHGLYWITYGLNIAEARRMDDITTINTDRIGMFCMRMLISGGRMIYRENPDDPEEPILSTLSDFRYIQPTHQEYLVAIEDIMAAERAGGQVTEFKDNVFKTGHLTFLKDAILMLFVGYHRDEAQDLLAWTRANYQPRGFEWLMSLEEFVVYQLNQPGRLTTEIARGQVNAAVLASLKLLAAERLRDFQISFDYAMKVYQTYQDNAAERVHLDPMDGTVAEWVVAILVRPELAGMRIPLTDRVGFYQRIEQMFPGIQAHIYPYVAGELQQQCQEAGIEFERAFPPPAGVGADNAPGR